MVSYPNTSTHDGLFTRALVIWEDVRSSILATKGMQRSHVRCRAHLPCYPAYRTPFHTLPRACYGVQPTRLSFFASNESFALEQRCAALGNRRAHLLDGREGSIPTRPWKEGFAPLGSPQHGAGMAMHPSTSMDDFRFHPSPPVGWLRTFHTHHHVVSHLSNTQVVHPCFHRTGPSPPPLP